MGYTHAMDYHSVLKMSEVLIHSTMWMNLENIKIDEISQPQKHKYYITPLI